MLSHFLIVHRWIRLNPLKSIIKFAILNIFCPKLKNINHFILPTDDWFNYYYYIEQKLPEFKRKYKDDPEAQKVITMEQKEVELYRRYSDYYGYVFYVMQNIN